MNKRRIKHNAKSIIQNAIDSGEWEESTDWEGDSIQTLYLGSVFSLTPSGKYYLPFACSNLKVCPRCKGKGCTFCGFCGSREAYEDEMFFDHLNAYASDYGCYCESGEGDPCDLFLIKSREL